MLESNYHHGSSVKQVEFNTFASGFGHLGPISTGLHRLGEFVFCELSKKSGVRKCSQSFSKPI